MARIHIEEYGCSASQADSEMIAGMLAAEGHTVSRDEEGADASVIVTCSVKDATAARMVHRMRRLSSRPLVVAGCMAEAEPATVRRIAPRASMMGPGSITRASELVGEALAGRRSEALGGNDEKVGLPRVRLDSGVGIVEIASGCMSECSFCQTKLAKGGLQSHRVGDIVRQVRADVRDGCGEIWLTSTDNGCYGHDIGSSLPELLRAVGGVGGDFGVRVGMMNPMYAGRILDGVADAMEDDPRIYRFLHIPVQSGSDAVLGAMRRGHTAGTFARACATMRERFGRFTIATDVIVGYPSETEADFAQTVGLLEATRPDIVNLSRYSSRPGTGAAGLARLDERTTMARSRRVHGIAGRLSLESGGAWAGWEGRVRLSGPSSRGALGRNPAYRQVDVEGCSAADGAVEARVTGATPHCLLATAIS